MKTPTQATPENRPESAQATTTNKPTPKNSHRPIFGGRAEMGHINFAAHPSQRLRLAGGNSNLSAIFAIGAAWETRLQVDGMGVTQTDQHGLRVLECNAEELILSLHSALAVLGKAMAYACDDMGPEDVRELGWLVAGIGEVAKDVAFARTEFAFELCRDFGGSEGSD